jgi:hypothetical protein
MAGQRVVIQGNERLRDGQHVRILNTIDQELAELDLGALPAAPTTGDSYAPPFTG